MKFEVIDNCPVPSEIADEIREVKRITGSTLVSCYRGEDAEPLLKRLGKMSQRQLFDGFVRGLPGFNPANRPRQSTHECYSDGVAYAGPVGRRLKGWQVGMDWPPDDVPKIIKAFAEIGWTAILTYPTSVRERQHVNVRRKGRQFIPFPVRRRGDHGRMVGFIRWALTFVIDPDTKKPYLDPSYHRKLSKTNRRYFGHNIENALKQFQRDWGQNADGIYGEQTHRQLVSRVRHRRQVIKAKREAAKS